MYVQFKGLSIRPTKSAYYELKKLDMDLFDVVHVLEEGYDCSTGKRNKDVLEKCIDSKNKTVKVVAVKSFEFWSKKEVYVIVHAGKIGRRKK
jgi:hypothetical protein